MSEVKFIAIYGRVSETENEKDSSVPLQMKDGAAFAKKRWPGEPVDTTFHEVVTARNIQGRPEFCRLLGLCKEGRISRIIVRDQDRLARSDAVELLQCCAWLRRYGVEIWQYRTGQQIRTDDPHSKLSTTIFGAIAEFERSISAVRVKDKMCAMRNEGKWTGGVVPLGYRLDTSTGQKSFVPDDKAPLVRRVFEVAAETRSLAAAWRESVRLGLWSAKQSLQHVLANRVFLGEWRKPGGGWIKNHHEPIIDEILFQRAQATDGLSYNPRVRKIERVFTLQGLVDCPHCQCLMTPYHIKKTSGLRYFYYECNCRTKRNCPVKRVGAPELESWVWEELSRLCQNPKILDVAIAEHERTHSSENAAAVAEFEAVLHQFKAAENRRAALLAYADNLFNQGKQPALSFNDKVNDADIEVAGLKTAVEEARAKARPPTKIKADQFLKSLRQLLTAGTFTPESQQGVFRALISRVAVEKTGIKVDVLSPSASCVMLAEGTTGSWFEQSSELAEREGFEPPRPLRA